MTSERVLRKRVLSVRLTEQQYSQLTELAKAQRRSVSNVVQIAVETFLLRASNMAILSKSRQA